MTASSRKSTPMRSTKNKTIRSTPDFTERGWGAEDDAIKLRLFYHGYHGWGEMAIFTGAW
jgi:hypothetical protein